MKGRTAEIVHVAKSSGADLVRFADLTGLLGFFSYTDHLLREFPYGVCVAVGLDKWGRYDTSTEDVFSFPLLEKIAGRVKKTLEEMGFSAKIIVPDKRVGHRSGLYWRGEISHKAAAKVAGLGWTGKSTLLVTPEFGPRVCLATILTDMPLPVGEPVMNQCGSCRKCVIACPLKVLKNGHFVDHPRSVDEAIDVKKCGALVNRTWKDGSLCYECMLACPKGKKTPLSGRRRRESV